MGTAVATVISTARGFKNNFRLISVDELTMRPIYIAVMGEWRRWAVCGVTLATTLNRRY